MTAGGMLLAELSLKCCKETDGSLGHKADTLGRKASETAYITIIGATQESKNWGNYDSIRRKLRHHSLAVYCGRLRHRGPKEHSDNRDNPYSITLPTRGLVDTSNRIASTGKSILCLKGVGLASAPPPAAHNLCNCTPRGARLSRLQSPARYRPPIVIRLGIPSLPSACERITGGRETEPVEN
ncbi:hypothetical protein J6590_053964 [Homalodisca vitripennis]|nr:hypothetical protein J6590_053964 [Homalodisca vitripennis]